MRTQPLTVLISAKLIVFTDNSFRPMLHSTPYLSSGVYLFKWTSLQTLTFIEFSIFHFVKEIVFQRILIFTRRMSKLVWATSFCFIQ